MRDGQDEIYYLTGETRNVVENSPHLEAFKEKGYEALYLTEPVDELLTQSLWDFEGKKLKSVGKGAIKFGGDEEEKKKVEAELKQKEEEAADLLAVLQKAVGERVKQVRRILELNPNHEIFNKMNDQFKRNKEDSAIADYAELLLGYSLLAEGSEISDLTKFNRLMVELMVKTL